MSSTEIDRLKIAIENARNEIMMCDKIGDTFGLEDAEREFAARSRELAKLMGDSVKTELSSAQETLKTAQAGLARATKEGNQSMMGKLSKAVFLARGDVERLEGIARVGAGAGSGAGTGSTSAGSASAGSGVETKSTPAPKSDEAARLVKKLKALREERDALDAQIRAVERQLGDESDTDTSSAGSAASAAGAGTYGSPVDLFEDDHEQLDAVRVDKRKAYEARFTPDKSGGVSGHATVRKGRTDAEIFGDITIRSDARS